MAGCRLPRPVYTNDYSSEIKAHDADRHAASLPRNGRSRKQSSALTDFADPRLVQPFIRIDGLLHAP